MELPSRPDPGMDHWEKTKIAMLVTSVRCANPCFDGVIVKFIHGNASVVTRRMCLKDETHVFGFICAIYVTVFREPMHRNKCNIHYLFT